MWLVKAGVILIAFYIVILLVGSLKDLYGEDE